MSFDYLIKNANVIDGAGGEIAPIETDVAIEDDSIKAIGKLSDVKAERIIDAKGLCLCPGFIDVHSHSEFNLLADGRASGKVAQGITTEINGNCGLSAAPLIGQVREQREGDLKELDIKERWSSFPEYFTLLEKKGFATNFVTLAGHGNIRASVSGYSDAPLTEGQIERTKELLRNAMNAGARGLSTGLIYPPGVYSSTEEIVKLSREVASCGGIYTTHMRSEGDELLQSIDEVLEIASKSGVHAHISHLKTSGEKNWHKINDLIRNIDGAIENSLHVTCDRYPYTASSTDLDSVLPSWVFEGGRKKEIERLKNDQKRIAAEILEAHQSPSYWENIVVASVNSDANKWMEGRNLEEISRSVNKPPVQALFDLLIDEDLAVGAIFFAMNEDNLREIIKLPYTMIGSDSSARSFDGVTAKGRPHPRGFGTFPRILGRYVRENGILPLPYAIYKMTGLAAETFRLDRRGTITEGNYADIVIFDPDRINDTADYKEPFGRPEGIAYVFVNGTPVVYEGELTDALPGKILR